jgi:hypothetical protein
MTKDLNRDAVLNGPSVQQFMCIKLKHKLGKNRPPDTSDSPLLGEGLAKFKDFDF